VPVLNLLATPLAPRFGGIPTQFLNRIAVEGKQRAVAVLSPRGAGLHVELSRPLGAGTERWTFPVPAVPPPGAALRDATYEAAVKSAAARLGARLVHAEGLAGLPLETLLALHDAGLRLVVSIHDFAAWCVRPHLVERPANAFCGYCADDGRCARCLSYDGAAPAGFLRRHRAAAGRLLGEADAVVYASDFLRREHERLFPGLAAARSEAIAPSSAAVARAAAGPPGPGRGNRHLAYVGAVHPHKGALVFEEVVRRLTEEPGLRFTVLGGGDQALLARLGRLPRVSLRGYYRAGSLPRLLSTHRVDQALLLSIWPEAHGLTLDECLAAGVPAVAFDHGAMADRLRRAGLAQGLVPPAEGASGVVRVIREPLPQVGGALGIPTPGQAAAAHLARYASLLGAKP
jgi:glycosyltransferase involved in cell wall biosynthesis